MSSKNSNPTISNEQSTTLRLDIQGRVSFETVEPLMKEFLTSIKSLSTGEIILNLEKVEYLDSAGAGMIVRLRQECQKRNLEFALEHIPPQISEFLKLFEAVKIIPPPHPCYKPRFNPLEITGNFVMEVMQDFIQMVNFIGRLAITMLWNLRYPQKIKWREVMILVRIVGINAIPIIGMLSLLIGLVSAFSSAVQLRQFGANIYIADLVGIGMTNEMGPLITAILLTGRSGSAFAAEIGTMKISDEIDALTVMGVKPIHYLIWPRLIAVMLTIPFLTLFSDLCGIFGGMVISITSLDLTPIAFINELRGAIGLWDVFSGVLKAFVFGILVAGVGCYRGLQTIGGALSVGKSTTSSVVSGITLIVIADSAFAILFHYLELA